jgi:hypothetical protein
MRLLLSKLKKIEQKQIGLFLISDQPSLNTGSVLEGIKKPGLIVQILLV